MKTTPLQRRTPLKSYSHLTTRVSLKNSRFVTKRMPDTPMTILDSIVSEVVRRGSANQQELAMCITCTVVRHWKEMQCGHFQRRSNLATRYDPQNLGVQCETCNCFNEGENEKFAEFIDAFYGEGTAENLRIKAQTIIHNFPWKDETNKWQAALTLLVEKQTNNIQY